MDPESIMMWGTSLFHRAPAPPRKRATPLNKTKPKKNLKKFTEKNPQGRTLLTQQDSTPCTTHTTPRQHTQEESHSTHTRRKIYTLSMKLVLDSTLITAL
jgi:hypothetical protein